jgi:lipoyl(octanoyl) transferase
MKKIESIEIKNSSNFIDYSHSLEVMEKRVIDIYDNKKSELIWFLNHNDIYTVGTSGNIKEIHSKIKIPLIKTNRGGKITYHGPGQRIVYILINLGNRKKDIKKFVKLIENSAIGLLQEFNIESTTFPNRVGIWVTKNNNIKLEKEKKIGAIGLRLKKWVSYHGMSFNINPNLDYFKDIDACGLPGYEQTSLKSLGVNINQKEFDKLYLKNFKKLLKSL